MATVCPAGIAFSANGRGSEQSVALFEKGVAEAMRGRRRAASPSFSSHPSVTSVSLLRRATSPRASRSPVFAAAG